MKCGIKLILFMFATRCVIPTCCAEEHMPKGLMLNLDIQRAKDGLIPSNTLYPLYTPTGNLQLEAVNHRNILAVEYGQGLDIPHSSLIDPDGSEWIVSVRAFILTDGLILSQDNGQHGFAFYVKDGAIQIALRTTHSTVILKERADRGITKQVKRWVTIELRVQEDVAIMSLNRQRVAMLPLQAPLKGKNMRLRLGNHQTLPSILKTRSNMAPTGFTGAISSLKVLRQ